MNEEIKDGSKFKAYITCLWTLVPICFNPRKWNGKKLVLKFGSESFESRSFLWQVIILAVGISLIPNQSTPRYQILLSTQVPRGWHVSLTCQWSGRVWGEVFLFVADLFTRNITTPFSISCKTKSIRSLRKGKKFSESFVLLDFVLYTRTWSWFKMRSWER